MVELKNHLQTERNFPSLIAHLHDNGHIFTSLNLEGYDLLTNEQFVEVLAACPNMTSLSLDGHKKLTKIDLSEQQHLRDLEIAGCEQLSTLLGLDKVQNIFISGSKIKKLGDLTAARKVKLWEMESLKKIGEMQAVEELHIEGSRFCVNEKLKNRVEELGDLPKARKVTLTCTVSLKKIGEMKAVEELFIQEGRMTGLGDLPKARKVTLLNLEFLTKVGDMEIVEELGIRCCDRLTELGDLLKARSIRLFDLPLLTKIGKTGQSKIDIDECPRYKALE